MATEIAEQPAVPAERGSSDHAARYAKYLIEVVRGLPAGLVSPSTVTLYGARTDPRDVPLISVSRHGGSVRITRGADPDGPRGSHTVTGTR